MPKKQAEAVPEVMPAPTPPPKIGDTITIKPASGRIIQGVTREARVTVNAHLLRLIADGDVLIKEPKK